MTTAGSQRIDSRVVPFVVWAELGVLSHVFLDEFTHDWGWFANHVSWYDNRIIDGEVLGRTWTVYRVFQYVGHVGLTALCIALLLNCGRQRWMQARADAITPTPTSTATYVTLWGCSTIGLAVTAAWVASDRLGSASDILRIVFGLFAGMLAGCLAVRALVSALFDSLMSKCTSGRCSCGSDVEK